MLDVVMGSREIISYRGWYAQRGGGNKRWASAICGPAECSVGYVSLWNPLC